MPFGCFMINEDDVDFFLPKQRDLLPLVSHFIKWEFAFFIQDARPVRPPRAGKSPVKTWTNFPWAIRFAPHIFQ